MVLFSLRPVRCCIDNQVSSRKWAVLECSQRPQARKCPLKEFGRQADLYSIGSVERNNLSVFDKSNQLLELGLSSGYELALTRMVLLYLLPHYIRVALAVDFSRGAPEVVIGLSEPLQPHFEQLV